MTTPGATWHASRTPCSMGLPSPSDRSRAAPRPPHPFPRPGQVPAPPNTVNQPLRALIFDSYYDPYRGVVCQFKVGPVVDVPGRVRSTCHTPEAD
jgi:hypothetical protein